MGQREACIILDRRGVVSFWQFLSAILMDIRSPIKIPQKPKLSPYNLVPSPYQQLKWTIIIYGDEERIQRFIHNQTQETFDKHSNVNEQNLKVDSYFRFRAHDFTIL